MRLKPKKRLGQNFLVDKNIRNKIVKACEFKPGDIVLEIGAGRGELTGLIAEKGAKVCALEIDPDLLKGLREAFKGRHDIEIIGQDVLKFNLKQRFAKCRKRVKVLGNIPYYISSPIIERLLEFKAGIEVIFLTVQKEFARRMAAPAGSKDYGSFSCFVQYQAEVQAVFNIKASSFYPAPKVDSSFVKLTIRPKPSVNPKDEALFFRIIRAAFNQRRKTLRNSLSGVVAPAKLDRFFVDFGIDKNTRPERLTLADFANLANL